MHSCVDGNSVCAAFLHKSREISTYLFILLILIILYIVVSVINETFKNTDIEINIYVK